jgi:23S rRNA pseudouridine955/2504/2580 synthase
MEFIIDKNYDDTRIDKYLRKQLENLPLGEIFKLFRKGDVKVNGKKVKENHRIFEGDKVFVYAKVEALKDEETFLELSQEEKTFVKNNIKFEDENMLVFYKESGIVMHKGSGFSYGISEMLKAYYKNPHFTFVNRIDKETSGLVLGSKNLVKTRELTEKIRERDISKCYYVIVKGKSPKNFTIKNKLKDTGEKIIVDKEGKEAITYFETLYSNEKYSLLKATLETGRKHQIRVQLANYGFPIVGDNKYGFREGKEMFLNSYSIEFEDFVYENELPKSFKEKLEL